MAEIVRPELVTAAVSVIMLAVAALVYIVRLEGRINGQDTVLDILGKDISDIKADVKAILKNGHSQSG